MCSANLLPNPIFCWYFKLWMALRKGPLKVAQLRSAINGGGLFWHLAQVVWWLRRGIPQKEQT
jgi:hypothetical protein